MDTPRQSFAVPLVLIVLAGLLIGMVIIGLVPLVDCPSCKPEPLINAYLGDCVECDKRRNVTFWKRWRLSRTAKIDPPYYHQ